jgi:hypothetical protein
MAADRPLYDLFSCSTRRPTRSAATAIVENVRP